MPHILSNKNITLHVEQPFEEYRWPRFDQTGKIIKVDFQEISLATYERFDDQNNAIHGRGFYNEFGIKTALGFEEARPGEWFHKIGVGLLKKTSDAPYHFTNPYELKPADFNVDVLPEMLTSTCKAPLTNGYAYLLKKQIQIHQDGFSISSTLKNTGEKTIVTTEYNHNFMSFNAQDLDNNFRLKFPFELNPKTFNELDNPEGKLYFVKNEISFGENLSQTFFIDNATSNQAVDATWTLEHKKLKIALSEYADFKTKLINIWGSKHVLSPELFHTINIKPGEHAQWTRRYTIKKIYG